MNANVWTHYSLIPPTVGTTEKATIRRATFIIPVVLMFLALFYSRHDWSHAIQAGGEELYGFDLVSLNEVNLYSKQLSYALLGLTGLFLLRMPSQVRFRGSAILIGLLSIAAMVIASCFWSFNPVDSIKGAIVPILILIFGLGIACQWTFKDLCLAVVLISTTTIAMGVFAEISEGTFLSGDEYRFSGLLHPNRQALNCGLMCLAAVTLWRITEAKSWLVVTAIGIVFLFLTGSRGGFMSVLVAAFAVWFLGSSRGIIALTIITLLGFLSLAVLWCAVEVNAQNLLSDLSTMGREADAASTSFTARIPIWQQVFVDAQQNFLVGKGINGFWTSDRIHNYSTIHDNWAFSNAHSIYLETFADLGLIGVLLIGLVTAYCLYKALKLHNENPKAGYFFVIACILLSAVNGLVEAIAIRPGYLFIVTVVGICMLTTARDQESQDSLANRLQLGASTR